MTRAVCTVNRASFVVVVVVEEVWARLCFEVLLTAPTSHLSDCCRLSLFIFCKHLTHIRPASSVGVAGFVRNGSTDVFSGLADQLSSGTLGEFSITNTRGPLRGCSRVATHNPNGCTVGLEIFTPGFKVCWCWTTKSAYALQMIPAPAAGADLCFL